MMEAGFPQSSFKPVYLIGLPGSGKTTLGKKLSEKLGIPFYDLDHVIEQRIGQSIFDFFRVEGETVFREMEKECLQEFLRMDRFILATGGGTACFFDHADQMRAHGTLVFLNPPLAEISKRLKGEGSSIRPLFPNTETVDDVLMQLFEQRIKYYQKAHITYAGSDPYELTQLLKIR
jgi:shikimate kinase